MSKYEYRGYHLVINALLHEVQESECTQWHLNCELRWFRHMFLRERLAVRVALCQHNTIMLDINNEDRFSHVHRCCLQFGFTSPFVTTHMGSDRYGSLILVMSMDLGQVHANAVSIVPAFIRT